MEAGLDHLITEVLDAVQVLQKLNLEGGVGVHIAREAPLVRDARVEVNQAPGPGLEAPHQRGEQQHRTAIIQLNPDTSEALVSSYQKLI